MTEALVVERPGIIDGKAFAEELRAKVAVHAASFEAATGRKAGLAATAIAALPLLIPADLRPDMPASLILAIAVTTGSAVWLASMRATRMMDGTTAGIATAAAVTVEGSGQPHDANAGGRATAPAAFSITARFAMAAGFGLIHGLGFASALQDLHLPRAMLLSSLLGFNVGVEIGQLAVVLAAVAVITIATKAVHVTERRAETSAVVASAALLAAGLAWFLTRAC